MNTRPTALLIMPPSLKGALEAAARGTTADDWYDDDGSTIADLEWALLMNLVEASHKAGAGMPLEGDQVLNAIRQGKGKDIHIRLLVEGEAWLGVASLYRPVLLPKGG